MFWGFFYISRDVLVCLDANVLLVLIFFSLPDGWVFDCDSGRKQTGACFACSVAGTRDCQLWKC